MAFRGAYNRIPCPSDLTLAPGSSNYGVEAATPSLAANVANQTAWDANNSSAYWQTCIGSTPSANFYSLNSAGSAVASAEGGVPTVALGLPNDFMYDGWGNHIHYVVDASMTTPASFVATPAGALCGPINVCDSGGITSGACTNTARSSAAIYALISHGPNAYGAYTQNGTLSGAAPSSNVNEQTNCHFSGSACPTLVSGTPVSMTPVYVQQHPGYQSSAYANNPAYYFDDIVTYKERWQMATASDSQSTVCPAIWVADTSNQRAQKFDLNGNYLMSIPPSSTSASMAQGHFDYIRGADTDSSGNFWSTDGNRIQKFSPSGQWLMTIGGPNTTAGDSSSNCGGVATSATTAAALPGAIGYCGPDQSSCACSGGSGNGEFGRGADDISVDASGNIWAGDNGNARLQKFSPSGQWLMTIGGGAACTGLYQCEYLYLYLF